MSRAYRHSNSGNGWFVFFILIGSALWAHKDLLPTIAHIATIILFTLGTTVFLVWIVKLILRIGKKAPTSINKIDNMQGVEFEKYIAQILKAQGYTGIRLTEKYDLGVDIVAYKDGICWGIQVKRYSGLVKASAVRQVVTALRLYGCDRGMVISNSYYSQPARKLAESNTCILINREGLLSWMS